ncbi:energy transducer TonB [Seonamhaeicola sp.]|uniref:energy transducer TonB n=1 Tax=Seonamhaeicola sp. TaxID=1912245 RepID=UPI002620EE4F|nr:energy transducer TonB [Seonamhaeicola sp.]
MKNTITILMLSISTLFFAQKKSNNKIFEVIENVPVYKGCNKNDTNKELTECMTQKIAELISKNFNTGIAYEIGLQDGLVEIQVIFKINSHGEVTDIKCTGPHSRLEEEAKRVISLIPNMERPALQKGKAINVPYVFPIQFIVGNTRIKKK